MRLRCRKPMTDYRSDRKHDALAWALPVLAWTIAWGVTGAALYISGVINSPRTGPLWVALAGGAISWSIAGAFTFRAVGHDSANRWNIAGFLIWALAYFVSFALAGFTGRALDDTLGGFFFMLLGWSIGPGLGAFASTWLLTDHSSLRRSGIVAGIWLLGFFAGSYIGFVGGYMGLLIGSVIGIPAAFILGFGLGCAAGGLVASVITVALSRLMARFIQVIL